MFCPFWIKLGRRELNKKNYCVIVSTVKIGTVKALLHILLLMNFHLYCPCSVCDLGDMCITHLHMLLLSMLSFVRICAG